MIRARTARGGPRSRLRHGPGGMGVRLKELRHADRVSDSATLRLEALSTLRERLAEAVLPLELSDSARAAQERPWAIQQIDDYIRPRLANLDAPLLAVVGGSTGAGKSTIVNGLVGHPVTRTGAIRPTTRQPILLHSPRDRGWFETDRILPGLSRITGTIVEGATPSHRAGADPDARLISSVVLVADERMPADLAIVDAPDVDSVADENRALAAQLLAAADLWCFVTTANRYADAVPWALLDDAARRDITVAVVLNRVPAGAEAEIEADLRRMLADRGLGGAPVFTITEQPLDALGMLPDAAVAPLRYWLGSIAADAAARHELARRTVRGSARQLAHVAGQIALARDAQLAAADELLAIVADEYSHAVDTVEAATKDGALLRGEVLARWQDYIGTSDVFRSVETWFGRARDRVGEWFTGRPAPIREVEQSLGSGLHAVIVDAAGQAAMNSWQRTRSMATGRQVITNAGLARESGDLDERAAALVRDWQAALMELVRDQSAGKRTQARAISLGLNAVTVALMIVVFASTAGLTGGELAIAGGSAVVGQKILETVFGDEAVRRLAAQARADLQQRVQRLFDEEAERYAVPLAAAVEPGDGSALRTAADEFVRALDLDEGADAGSPREPAHSPTMSRHPEPAGPPAPATPADPVVAAGPVVGSGRADRAEGDAPRAETMPPLPPLPPHPSGPPLPPHPDRPGSATEPRR